MMKLTAVILMMIVMMPSMGRTLGQYEEYGRTGRCYPCPMENATQAYLYLGPRINDTEVQKYRPFGYVPIETIEVKRVGNNFWIIPGSQKKDMADDLMEKFEALLKATDSEEFRRKLQNGPNGRPN